VGIQLIHAATEAKEYTTAGRPAGKRNGQQAQADSLGGKLFDRSSAMNRNSFIIWLIAIFGCSFINRFYSAVACRGRRSRVTRTQPSGVFVTKANQTTKIVSMLIN